MIRIAATAVLTSFLTMVGMIVWAAYETHYKPKVKGHHHE